MRSLISHYFAKEQISVGFSICEIRHECVNVEQIKCRLQKVKQADVGAFLWLWFCLNPYILVSTILHMRYGRVTILRRLRQLFISSLFATLLRCLH